MATRSIVTDGALASVGVVLHDIGDDPTGRIMRSFTGIRGMLDALLEQRTIVQRLVAAGHPGVTQADVDAVTALHGIRVQAAKDWANALPPARI